MEVILHWNHRMVPGYSAEGDELHPGVTKLIDRVWLNTPLLFSQIIRDVAGCVQLQGFFGHSFRVRQIDPSDKLFNLRNILGADAQLA